MCVLITVRLSHTGMRLRQGKEETKGLAPKVLAHAEGPAKETGETPGGREKEFSERHQFPRPSKELF